MLGKKVEKKHLWMRQNEQERQISAHHLPSAHMSMNVCVCVCVSFVSERGGGGLKMSTAWHEGTDTESCFSNASGMMPSHRVCVCVCVCVCACGCACVLVCVCVCV